MREIKRGHAPRFDLTTPGRNALLARASAVAVERARSGEIAAARKLVSAGFGSVSHRITSRGKQIANDFTA